MTKVKAEHKSHGKTHEHELDKVLAKLKKAGFKITSPRIALLEVLLNEHGPFTIEELHDKISSHRCDIVTIYRNMATFEQMNLVQQCDFGDGTARYEFVGDGHEHHHHIICRTCHKLENIEYCFVKELEKLVRDRGYANVSHTLEFYGICNACQSKA